MRSDPTFWLLARSSGFTAYVLLTASGLAGLVLKSRPFGRAVKAASVLELHRFIALLLELDRADALTFHPSKTPAEYVREARLGATGRATLAGLVSRLYHHVFGAEPLDERGYREFGAAAGTVLHHVIELRMPVIYHLAQE